MGAHFEALDMGVLLVPFDPRYIQVGFNLVSVQVWYILKINFLLQESCCDDYIEQLIPTSSPIGKIKLKIFGHSGTGKTALIESLKAGYFSGLFRRSKKSSSSFQNNSSRYPH